MEACPHLPRYSQCGDTIRIPTGSSIYRLDGRIFNANFTYTAGGVGRNICESLCKLGFPPNFLTVVGADDRGKMIMSVIPPQSRHFVRVDDDCNTAECIVVFDKRGSCRLLMGDMKIHNKITPEVILENESIIKTAPLIILDSNLSVEAIEECLKMAVKHNIPVLFEPTDVEPSTKPFKTPHWKAIKFITPNLSELEHIARFFDIVPQKSSSDIAKAEELSRKLLSHGIDNVIVTLGSKGVLVARKGLATENFFTNYVNEEHVRFYPTEAINSLVNVSGAGDCFASGFIAALISNMPEEVCVSVGFAAAKLALKCQAAVPMEIFDRRHQSWERSASYEKVL